MATVYIGMTADIVHPGLINIIQRGAELGEVTVGLLTDSAIADYKRIPYMSWEQRNDVVANIKGVSRVVPQDEWSYAPNIRTYRPDYFIHGDDWVSGPMVKFRSEALEALNDCGGQLIEIPYTRGLSSGAIALDAVTLGSTPEMRRRHLQRAIQSKPIVKLMEAHNPLSALIVEEVSEEVEGKMHSFDGFWSSSLTDSTVRGKPDIEAVDISTRLAAVNDIFEVTTKPLVMDADTGGKLEHFEMHVRAMERLGISAVIIEDKTGLKRNSLFGTEVAQTQESIEVFSEKIRAGVQAATDPSFMVIARVESLILNKGQKDALTRADSYVDAGANAVMIHSRLNNPDEVFEFAKSFKSSHPDIPLVSVPTSYNKTTDLQLADAGFNVVIYANQLLRAAYPAMRETAKSILRAGRSYEADKQIISINEILRLIPGTAP